MTLLTFPSGPFDTNAYLVGCPATKKAAFIDPSPDSAPLLIKAAEQGGWIPEQIILTHSHWDHIADVYPLQQHYSIPVYVHRLDAPNLIAPGTDGLPCWLSITGVQPTGFLEEGQNVSVGQLTFKVIHTPGHSPGGICLYCPEAKLLISGDTLFKGSIGNISFSTAQPELMWSSLDKLSALPHDTSVYPGHGPATTIGQEAWLPKARQIFGN